MATFSPVQAVLTPARARRAGFLPGGRSQSRFFWTGTALVAACALTAALAPWIAPYSPDAYVTSPLASPSARHLLGANEVGQDLLSQVIYGSRVSMTVALATAAVGVALALLVGMASGTVGGFLDLLLMRLVDVLMAIPHLPLLIVLAVFLGPGLLNVILLIASLSWARPARVIRSQVLSLRSRGYLQAARLCGAGWIYLTGRHLLPAVSPIAVAALVSLAGRAVLMEASLAFLGIGDPTLHSWGIMINQALTYKGIYLTTAWVWWVLPPGVCLSLLILGLTMLSTSVESYANARLSRHQGRA